MNINELLCRRADDNKHNGPSSESKSCRPRKPGQSSKWSYSQRRSNFPRIPKFLDPPKLGGVTATSFGPFLLPARELCFATKFQRRPRVPRAPADIRAKQNYLATVWNSLRRSTSRLTSERQILSLFLSRRSVYLIIFSFW